MSLVNGKLLEACALAGLSFASNRLCFYHPRREQLMFPSHLISRLAVSLGTLVAANAFAATDTIEVAKFQPPIVVTVAPSTQMSWSIERNVRRAKLAPFQPIVPSPAGPLGTQTRVGTQQSSSATVGMA
jgi:hypothetical protein